MQNKHYKFFFIRWPNLRGGGGPLVGSNAQVFPREFFFLEGSLLVFTDVYGADTDAYDYYSDLRDICDVDTDGDLYWSVWGKFILGVALAYHHHCQWHCYHHHCKYQHC